jgi:hypothetical protein
MMEIGFHPLNILVYTITAGMVIAAVRLVQGLRNGDTVIFGFAALSMIAWLSAFSYLSGFSIGWLVSIIATVLGVVFLLSAQRYRLQISIATLISSLLALSLRGFFDYGRVILWAILAGISLYSAVLVINSLRSSDPHSTGPVLLAGAASLAGLSLIVPGVVTIGIVVLAIAVSIPGVVYIRRYRLEFALILIASTLWLINILIQT